MRRGVYAYAGTAVAVLLAAVYLVVDPQSADLAAQEFRAQIASDYGFAIYNPYWYGGHHLPGYSLLTPPLFALTGPQVAGAGAAVVGTCAFERLAHRYGPATPAASTIASCWFAVAMVATTLVTGRLTFAVGTALALTALALLPRVWAAALTGALAGLASPVAAAFLALALVVWAWQSRRYRAAAAVAIASLLPAVALMLLFPGGGSFPFILAALLPTLAATIVLFLAIPTDQPLLRKAVLAIVVLVAVSGLVISPMGGNATRPGTLLAGSIAILALWPRHRRRLLILAPVLLYWQLSTPFDDWWQARDDPSTQADYYTPLKAELRTRTAGAPVRIEVPFTDNHWEARHLPGDNLMLARGWERQLDRKVNKLFYDDKPLTAGRYRRWLDDNAVHYVALPDAPLDYSAADEAELIRARPSYLREVWHNRDWQLFAVRDPAPLARQMSAEGASAVSTESVAPDKVRIRVSRPGTIELRMADTRYWRAKGGATVKPAPNSRWTLIQAERSGLIELQSQF